MSLSRCQAETTYPEFLGWSQFFQEEDAAEIERTEKWEHYMARLSALILQANGLKNITEKDTLLHFKVQGVTKPSEKPVTLEQRVAESHAFWDTFFAVHKAVEPHAKQKGGL